MEPFDGVYSRIQKVIIEHFLLDLTVFKTLDFKFCELENVGQGHDAQHS